MKTVVNSNPDVYYHEQYWNDIPLVREYMSENFTGDKNKWWVQDFKERFSIRKFDRGLFLNCGNGWVERDFIDQRIVKRAIAFDYSLDLLRMANNEKGEREIDYFQTDVNQIDFDEDQFDLVVNVAALHHVQFINRLCCILCKSLRKDGLIVNYDYVGPYRNQYSLTNWHLINHVNRSLPGFIRKTPFTRPHLPSMLVSDPTEAIHSDLIFETLSRYFDIFERHDTGGGIAYEILTHNPRIQSLPPETQNQYVNRVLSLDRKYTTQKKVPTFFSYFIAKPIKETLVNKSKVERFQEAEN